MGRDEGSGAGGRGGESWEKCLELGEFGGECESWCNRNSLESMRVILVKTPDSGVYGTRTGHLL